MSEKRRSERGSERDPFQVWREWVDQAERQLNSVLAETMESERFGRSSGRTLDLLMGFQSAMSSATQRYFSTLNLPTRTDILQLGDRLTSIEERLLALEQTLSSLVPAEARRQAPAANRPKRTRRPPQEGAAPTAEPTAVDPSRAGDQDQRPNVEPSTKGAKAGRSQSSTGRSKSSTALSKRSTGRSGETKGRRESKASKPIADSARRRATTTTKKKKKPRQGSKVKGSTEKRPATSRDRSK